MRSLASRTSINTTKFLAVLAIVLFASAGTVRYSGAWIYLLLNAAWLAVCGVYFGRKDPALVERRLLQEERGEKQGLQRTVMAMLRILGLATLVVSGLDRRFGWSTVPLFVVVGAVFVFVAGAFLVFAVFAENSYTSSIIEVEPGQRVVTTGPYRILRHPFYTGTLLMGVATPVLLGSYWGALPMPLGWVLLVVRILDEERFLADNLPGYADYIRNTRSRLIPVVW